MDQQFFRFKIFLFLIIGGLFFIAGSTYAESAHVKRVIDGDTVVLDDNTRVRLIGINAPEIENRDFGHRGEPFGEEAKVILKNMVERKQVDLEDGPEKLDRYHRRLAYLYLPEHFSVNRRLIEVGAAEAYLKFDHPYRSEYIEVESQAKQNKIGMWAVERRAPNWWERLWGTKQ